MALYLSRKLICFLDSLADQLFASLIPVVRAEPFDSPLSSPIPQTLRAKSVYTKSQYAPSRSLPASLSAPTIRRASQARSVVRTSAKLAPKRSVLSFPARAPGYWVPSQRTSKNDSASLLTAQPSPSPSPSSDGFRPQFLSAKTVDVSVAAPYALQFTPDARLQIEEQSCPPEAEQGNYCKWKGVQTKLPPTKKSSRYLDQQIIPAGVIHGRIGKKFPKRLRPKTKGMKNSGVDCYKSSALQALLHVPAFYHYLGNIHQSCVLPVDKCVVCALQHLVQAYWNDESLLEDPPSSGNKPPACPTECLEQLSAACKDNVGDNNAELRLHLTHTMQSDPSLLLDLLFDEIQQQSPDTFFDFFELGKKKVRTCGVCNYQNHIKEVEDERKDNYVSLHLGEPDTSRPLASMSLVSLIFEEMANVKMSARCNSEECRARYEVAAMAKRRQQTEQMQTQLHSDFIDQQTFNEEVARLCNLEPGQLGIEGEENTCRVTITKAPEILFVKLNRLYLDMRTYQEKKNVADVHYEEFLDLTTYTEQQEPLVYRLDAVVAHRNISNTNGGHYTAALRETEGVRRFCNVNDDCSLLRARGGDFAEMQRPYTGCPPGEYRATPTLLVYSKVCGEV
ncbi:cysteine proteinase [Polychaeton citri CBS 116435]|uniref:Cysteine proteinase n=1 Tax=Polychaeton citri CBS 116435 TaxID=1314669 RepID=A0A9P4QA72_9PEZI|nr:cysteine proteinase [Polychaeton citri CBS 116435]